MRLSNSRVANWLAIISNAILAVIFISNFRQLLNIHAKVQEQLKLPVLGEDPAAVIANLQASDVATWQWLVNGLAIAISIALLLFLVLPGFAKYRPWVAIISLVWFILFVIYMVLMIFLLVHGLNNAFA